MNISKKIDFVVRVNYPFTGLFPLRRSISGVDMTSLFQNDLFQLPINLTIFLESF